MSKGSKRRKLKVDRKTFEENWDKIFTKESWSHECDGITVTKPIDVMCPYCGKKRSPDGIMTFDRDIQPDLF